MDEELSWSDAEQNCIAWGGHLASVQSKDEFDKVVLNSGGNDIWTGGVKDSEGTWTWTNGNPWGNEIGDLKQSSQLNCLYLNSEGHAKAWRCTFKKRSLCQSSEDIRKKSFQKQWTLGAKDFKQPLKLDIIFTHKLSDQNDSIGRFEGRNQSGFSVEWYVEGMKPEFNETESVWVQGLINVPRYENHNAYLVKMVNFANRKDPDEKPILEEKIMNNFDF